ncbi:MAG: tRNA (adenosine(37)-N6)-threonylcarbamoyltransferase complex ATPase subunit type 1 TsaE [Candidatus Lloydbacteria bacterium CG22_combo_CG10-13_8_21_14_all_47_15]|uniref:tRNA threonylcarbamoyladenosine biosynthesis protein TsaE n=1 Tax=Candidatus Lloydbacteria bacterium CG22_combo_CG10-13_8_21_14_all_47_15 TaxID=1974635 RepID=A0A2H0CU83_9BACT|nr:MAG: tRNA (adenosine(37)-N6)-threonylcarbamoyltransferase complex ATPase subunit type 1 TsaE [Candidatus Lloydbacteria bacterium CG22_combo_CG10-13_8_21_14_all_47_15]
MEVEKKKVLAEEEMNGVARIIARKIMHAGPRKDGATVVALAGELGTGKTTFTKAFARELGITEPVVSPTFILSRTYHILGNGSFERFVHIDAYRLSGSDELSHLGWNDIMADTKAIVVVEWAERIRDALPDCACVISFEHTDGDMRAVTIEEYAKEKNNTGR